jgi:hypothetical protein
VAEKSPYTNQLSIRKTQLNSVAAANHVCTILHTVANLPFYTLLRAALCSLNLFESEVRIVWVYGDFSATLYKITNTETVDTQNLIFKKVNCGKYWRCWGRFMSVGIVTGWWLDGLMFELWWEARPVVKSAHPFRPAVGFTHPHVQWNWRSYPQVMRPVLAIQRLRRLFLHGAVWGDTLICWCCSSRWVNSETDEQVVARAIRHNRKRQLGKRKNRGKQ